jgi:hypothetical protein
MTFETHVFISEKDLPTAMSWVDAVEQSTYDLAMRGNFEMPGDKAHFIPCDVENLQSGFDLKIEVADFDEYNLSPRQRAQIGDRNRVAHFQTYCNSQEIAGMVIASALLAENFDGVIVSELEEDLVLHGHNIAFIDKHLTSCRKNFDGDCKMRATYDPADPTANTIPKENAWLAFVLLAMIGSLIVAVSLMSRAKNLLAKFTKNPDHNSNLQEAEGEEEDLAPRP